MGRTSKVRLFDLLERVIELHESQHKTIKEIEAQLRDEGYDIPKRGKKPSRRKRSSSGDEA